MVSIEDVVHFFASLDFPCSSTNEWNYGQGFAICTSQACCVGFCVNACSFSPVGGNCDAPYVENHQRLCPCEPRNCFVCCSSSRIFSLEGTNV